MLEVSKLNMELLLNGDVVEPLSHSKIVFTTYTICIVFSTLSDQGWGLVVALAVDVEDVGFG